MPEQGICEEEGRLRFGVRRWLYRPGYATPISSSSLPLFSLSFSQAKILLELSLLMLVPHVYVCLPARAHFLASSPCTDSPSLQFLLFHAAELHNCCCDSDESSLLFGSTLPEKPFFRLQRSVFIFFLIPVLACFLVAFNLLPISTLLNCF